MKEILLTQGKVALVDDCDYEFLLNFGPWYAVLQRSGNFYVVREEKGKTIYMHRVIIERMKPGFKEQVDHKDGNGCNNQRLNIRTATYSQNSANRRPLINCSSEHKGVCWHKQHQKWMVTIMYKGTRSYLGYFDNEEEAAKAYDRAARRLHGPFAKLNFPEE